MTERKWKVRFWNSLDHEWETSASFDIYRKPKPASTAPGLRPAGLTGDL